MLWGRDASIQNNFPSERPGWHPNTNKGKEDLDNIPQVVLRGIKAATRRPTNLSKMSEVIKILKNCPLSS